ncbi:sel1 repeat family protein [Bacteroides acidifaciens]|uniref:Sel1 repeat family protein n=3 Tax=Bacteroides acidifaciens TaxID=85831 RepID=A0A7K3MFR0_9BACE|nr:SEL1-like repeat protein [Bacteroides acidifaciens]MBF0731666.1 sel1 repeat family protein [Bacteroides acidifaciens]NDO53114.1 sel1 repeat family protein [Bacteroides acidifaciens]TFU45091.1 sel1 repeat family protein [Bacteroides acidifaciens]
MGKSGLCLYKKEDASFRHTLFVWRAYNYLKAASNISAILKLADCYKRGIGCKADYSKAMEEYLHMAERTGRYWERYVDSIGTALYEIGNMYMNGLGVGIDLKKAHHYFKLAVKKGNLDAENALNNKKFRDFKI